MSPDTTLQAPPPAAGDEAPLGTPGTALTVCRRCGGTGRLGPALCHPDDPPTPPAPLCPECDGCGMTVQGVGGG